MRATVRTSDPGPTAGLTVMPLLGRCSLVAAAARSVQGVAEVRQTMTVPLATVGQDERPGDGGAGAHGAA